MPSGRATDDGSFRSHRVKHDKFGRLAAFEKLRSLKGTKHKYEVVEETPVYDEVTEKEYSRIIQKRQKEDWIENDSGSGYVEDGREIFDDLEDDIYTDKKAKQPPKKNFAGSEKGNVKSSDIKNMFKSLPIKRKSECDIKLDDDDILGNIMEDLHKEASSVPSIPKPMVLHKKHKLNYSPMQHVIVDVPVDSKSLPLKTNENGDTVLRFFWLDAFEDPYKQPGTVYLFGKVYLEDQKAYVSCCVIVKDISRRLFFLPRETEYDLKTKRDLDKPVTMQDVYMEVNGILEKMKITEFRSKKILKNYAFGSPEIPDVCEYLEVQYSAKHPPVPTELKGSTFSHVLGTDSLSLEMLLLEQKIKGPCWLDVHYPQISNPPVSWCKIEAFVTKMKNIVCTASAIPIPPVVLMCFNLTTAVNSKTQQNEIVGISCLSHHQFPLDKSSPLPLYQSHFAVLTKPSDCIFPYDFKDALTKYHNIKVERVDSEHSLLIYFLAKLQKLDPDVIVGHDVLGFDLDILLHRMVMLKTPNWSRIGRLKRTGMPRLNVAQGITSEKNATCGRLLCDVKISSKELIRCKSYDLEELANQILNKKFSEIPPECVPLFYSNSKQLIQLIDHGMMQSELILQMNCELNILPLGLQITNIAGCVMSRTLMGGRSERNEFLLLHAFHAKNFIYPPKAQTNKKGKISSEGGDHEEISKKGRRKPAYEGGLVLDPKRGFYDKYILLMDFNSLYPSIIQEYNICFTTIPRIPDSELKDEEELELRLPDAGIEAGVLPTEIRKLVESRKQVKQMMKGSDVTKEKYAQYDIRQRALKLTANSMYGCLGFTHSRFYAKPLAALITRKGREILLKTKELVEKMGLDVIYGDTDSIMINTNQIELDDVAQLGNKVKSEINKLYRLLEIDIDGVYKPMLLLKKKKYAALAVSRLPNGQIKCKEEIKGLDIVRRDWSQLAKDAGQYVIQEILSSKSKDEVLGNIHSHLVSLGQDVKEGKKSLSDYIIYKQLTKNPEDYANKKNLPHVMVAARINEKGGKKLKMGDTVSYIICLDGTDEPATQRAYHPDELKSNSALKIDVFYYLAQQIHPVVSRLCEPIEGTDAAMIAELLGLDSSKYQTAVREAEEEEDKLLNPSSLFDDKDRFKNCDKLKVKCPSLQCKQEIIIDSTFRIEPSSVVCQLDTCLKCKAKVAFHAPALCNQLQKTMRQYISKYYKHILICEDVGCAYQTRKMPLIFTSGGPVCPSCRNSNLRLEYSEAHLYTQLSYFRSMFDIAKAKSVLSDDEKDLLRLTSDDEAFYERMRLTAEKILDTSGYGIVNLSELFQGLFEKPRN